MEDRIGIIPPPPPFPVPPVALDDTMEADPFNPAMRYPSDHADSAKRRCLTPLGLLVEIDAWTRRYEKAIREVSERHPHDPFSYLIDSLRACLKRECPGASIYQTQP